jgi:D-alanine-D-alanine ligase
MRVLIIHDRLSSDARADERDVLDQVDAVSRGLAAHGHEADLLPVGLDLDTFVTEVRSRSPDLVFNLVESLGGQGRLIHLPLAVLDGLGVPYTGASTDAMFLTSHKVLAKERLAADDLPTPPWFDEAALAGGAEVPVVTIVKSTWEHGSVGLDEDSVQEGRSATDLLSEIDRRRAVFGGSGFAEAYIEGREFNLALLDSPEGVEVLPPAEIVFEGYGPGKRRVVGYRAKWDVGAYEYHHTPRRFSFPPADTELLDELRSLARRAWDVFRLRGHARVDFRVDGDGRPWILEVNANPCISRDAGFAAAVAAAGLQLDDAIARILGAGTRDRRSAPQ